MKRIFIAGVAVAGLLTIGVATGSAATGSKSKSTKVSCHSSLGLAVPAGATDVTQGATAGSELGTTKCSTKHFSKGLMNLTFTTDAAGDETGSFQQYFKSGSVSGTFTLTPVDSGLQGSFTAATYTGAVKIKSGTGVYKGITGKGTMTCSTADAVHFSCTSKLKDHLPAGA